MYASAQTPIIMTPSFTNSVTSEPPDALEQPMR